MHPTTTTALKAQIRARDRNEGNIDNCTQIFFSTTIQRTADTLPPESVYNDAHLCIELNRYCQERVV